MSYSAVPKPAVGDPVTKDLFDGVIDNQADFDTRVTAVEAGGSKIHLINDPIFNTQQYTNMSGSLDRLWLFQAKANMTLTDAIVTVVDAATSGTVEFDILLSTTGAAGTFNTVFSTKPSTTTVAAGTESTNKVFSTTAVSTGDWLRMDITSLMVGGKTIHIELTAEPG